MTTCSIEGRHAREKEGKGDWVCIMNEGDPATEVWASKKWKDEQDARSREGPGANGIGDHVNGKAKLG